MERDKYGNEVSKDGRPLPLEYLLVDVPAAFPIEPRSTFNIDENKSPFAVENRVVAG